MPNHVSAPSREPHRPRGQHSRQISACRSHQTKFSFAFASTCFAAAVYQGSDVKHRRLRRGIISSCFKSMRLSSQSATRFPLS
ncbi:hypothetical protein K469DRAFT_345573 [Zopfia rhizophila CBS 207.26]|uniref:Uncharacterized protein n=1 Tax=Zopfia rhizophila CBS 207.26 TaxID=1314779 RepID=A0A6A6EPX0_9PEZI|nr:hypothetical protein K469DRAFT_345573 [Zopfia rhizophila CBS 207.26]